MLSVYEFLKNDCRNPVIITFLSFYFMFFFVELLNKRVLENVTFEICFIYIFFSFKYLDSILLN